MSGSIAEHAVYLTLGSRCCEVHCTPAIISALHRVTDNTSVGGGSWLYWLTAHCYTCHLAAANHMIPLSKLNGVN